MVDINKTKIYLNYIGLIELMDIDNLPFNQLKQFKEFIFMKLGEKEVLINFYKQKKYKSKVIAQKNIVKINYDKKHLKKLLNEVDKRIKRGW